MEEIKRSPKILNFTDQEIIIEMNYLDPNSISAGGIRDIINATLLNQTYYLSEESR